MAAREQPEEALILDRLGQTYLALDRPADAVRVLRKASSLAPDDSKIQFHFARALEDAGETAEAKAAMDCFKQMGPARSDRVPAGLAEYLSMTPEQRLADYRSRVEKALHEDPGDAGLRLRYAQILYATDKPVEALAALNEVLKTGSKEARLMKAVALEIEGQRAESERLLGEIQNQWPDWYPVSLARRAIQRARGRGDDGSRELRGLLTKPPADVKIPHACLSGLSDNEDVTRAIARDPETMHGVPVFRGTRVPVQTLFEYLEGGETLEDFLEGFPTVSRVLSLEALEEAKQLLLARV